ncbi:hypothetical protein HAV1_gp01 [Hyperthermophilic Archaeal Virus 1]|uniref:hypothetical protein n=1 Tax=Hyperthermophilic Archaeal Virus 1 TaxID=762905 RepID=UPI0001DBADEC|nr:hypothetical protein HAV1_gp01 [Hyperthermophilic Archaeal Virus 1]ADJ54224.1 hypothetical protein HAV1_gp01 [Hyperthermophilic Archaeal Virus 1]
MNTKHKYRNRAVELERLINVLKSVGIYNVEELTTTFARTVKSYVEQLHIEFLTPEELEYVWIKLLD